MTGRPVAVGALRALFGVAFAAVCWWLLTPAAHADERPSRGLLSVVGGSVQGAVLEPLTDTVTSTTQTVRDTTRATLGSTARTVDHTTRAVDRVARPLPAAPVVTDTTRAVRTTTAAVTTSTTKVVERTTAVVDVAVVELDRTVGAVVDEVASTVDQVLSPVVEVVEVVEPLVPVLPVSDETGSPAGVPAGGDRAGAATTVAVPAPVGASLAVLGMPAPRVLEPVVSAATRLASGGAPASPVSPLLPLSLVAVAAGAALSGTGGGRDLLRDTLAVVVRPLLVPPAGSQLLGGLLAAPVTGPSPTPGSRPA